MHESCFANQAGGCRFKCFAGLHRLIQQYTSELSKVFFRKKALQSDRRWWLSAFYSLLIQAPVRQTLVMIQAQSNAMHLIEDPGPTPCSQYCYTALNIFDAASAGWDPITSDHDLVTLMSGSDIDQKVAKHITVARDTILKDYMGDETHNSFEFLRKALEMGRSVKVKRRGPARRASSQVSTAMATQPALSIVNANQTAQSSDAEYAGTDHVENDDSDTGHLAPIGPHQSVPMDGVRGYKARTNKRRATSPPQEDDSERRRSIDKISQLASTEDDASDRANSISSINSFSSINAAYGTLALDSPGSGQSSRLISSGPQSPTPDNMQKLDTPGVMSFHECIRQWAEAKFEIGAVEKIQGSYTCDCCPKNPKKFDTHAELR